MDNQNQKTIRQRFWELPPAVLDWLTSDRATQIVIDLNKRMGFKDDLISVMPFAITKLVIKDLGQQEFIAYLTRQLDISKDTARSLAKELFNNILKPIIEELKKTGLDLNELALLPEPSLPMEPAVEEPIMPAGIIEREPLPGLDALKSKSSFKNSEPEIPAWENGNESAIKPPATPIVSEAEPLEVSPSTELGINNAEPFILHQEKPLFEPSEMSTERPSVSFQPSQIIRKPATKPTIARIEMPPEANEGEDIRVVHYSELRTPLDTDAKNAK